MIFFSESAEEYASVWPDFEGLASDLIKYICDNFSIPEPDVYFRPINDQDILRKTAHYQPSNKEVVVFVTERHPKDVLRSLAHELIHHHQNCNNRLTMPKSVKYAQEDDNLREIEKEAYQTGNIMFRDWEDSIKYSNKHKNLHLESADMSNNKKNDFLIYDNKDFEEYKELQEIIAEAKNKKEDNLTSKMLTESLLDTEEAEIISEQTSFENSKRVSVSFYEKFIQKMSGNKE